jgi:flagellar biosynthesis protein FlhA
MVTHLAEVARRHAADLLSRQDVQAMIETLRPEEPLLANEVGSEQLPLPTVHAVLRGLLAEQVSVRDLSRILDAISSRSRETRSVEQLVAAARSAVGAGIVAKIAPDGSLGVITLDPMLEASLHECLRDVDGEIRLVADPARMQLLRDEAERLLARPSAEPVALICAQAVRGPLQRLLAGAGLQVPVLAYPELPGHTRLVPKGVIGDVHAHTEAPA